MPIELWKGLDERQRGTLLVHELAHLRRGDHRVRIFELVVTALYWWNPVLWWARQALRDVEEQCCDAWVVWAFPEAAKSYAETLLETLDFLNHSELSEPLLASGFGKVQHLRRRLTMIMSGTTPRLLGLRGTLAALSLGALLLPINASWAQKPEEQQGIQVVVKPDDGDDKVITKDAVEATSTFVIANDTPDGQPHTFKIYSVAPKVARQTGQVQIVGDDGKPVTATVTLSENSFIVDDANAVKPDVKAHVNVVVTTDDSNVSISADSLDEALKKITEEIKALKSKTPQGDKEQAQQKALSQIVKQLEQLVTSQKGPAGPTAAGAAKGKGAMKNRFVIRSVEGFPSSDANPANKAQIDGLRNEVKKLSQALAEAQRKLAKLEGRSADVKVFSLPGNAESIVDRRTAVVRIPENLDLKAAATPLAKAHGLTVNRTEPKSGKLTFGSAVNAGKADEDRIQALEKKLNQVIETLEKLKKSKGD
jgi:bla regulator protein blaR1